MGSINGNEGDLTGLGNDTSYYNKDLYVQWETSDGKVSDKVPLGTFITGHPENTSTEAPTNQEPSTEATTQAPIASNSIPNGIPFKIESIN